MENKQASQWTEQKRQGRAKATQGADLTEIKLSIARIEERQVDMKDDISEVKKDTGDLVTTMGTVQNRVSRVEERLSIFAVFASIFAVVTGAISTYLGTRK